MTAHLHAMTYLVKDYDEAIAWFTSKLNFDLVEVTDLGNGKRWVHVKPKNGATGLILAKASNEEQLAAIGNQTGGRVMMFLHTEDFYKDYEAMKGKGVRFLEEPREEEYGIVIIFEDLYGQKWDMIERRS